MPGAALEAAREEAAVPPPQGVRLAGHSPAAALPVPLPAPRRVLNAYLDRDDVVAVVREGDAVRLHRERVEYSVCALAADLGPWVDRLRRHPAVVDVDEIGEWRRIRFASRGDCDAFCRAAGAEHVQTYDGMVSPVLRWMVDNRVGVERPRVCYLDLETDSRVPFSRKGEMRILCWYLFGERGMVGGTLRADTDARERELLESLWAELDGYDLVAAWNGDRFDFPVLAERTRARGLLVDTRRWLWLDQLELFRRSNTMAAESGDEKQSYALGAVATSLLGVGKHDFDASKTWQAWAAGGARRAEMAAYCEQDVRLLPAIEERTGYIELLLNVGEACGSFADTRGINPTAQADAFLSRLAVDRGHRFPTKLWQSRQGGEFKGAYVMEPAQRGIMRNVHVADFAALYPSIIRTWNMSPETLLPKSLGRDRVGAFSAIDECFRLDVEGLLPQAVAEMVRLRKAWNDKKAAATPGTPEWTEADRRSTAYKIAANSFFGVVGSPWSRHFNKAVAESVSQTAAWLLQTTAAAAQREGLDVVYADTDSIFVAGTTRGAFSAFVERCNSEMYPRLLGSMGCEGRESHIKLVYEKAFERVVFVSAKRYCGSYSHYKGTEASADSRPEIKGLEYKRGDSLRLARQLQEEATMMLVGFGRPASDAAADFEALLGRWRERVATAELEVADVLVSKRLSRELKGYKRKKLKSGDDSRLPPHVEVAHILAERGRDMGEGAKVEYFVVGTEGGRLRVAPAEDWAGVCDRAVLWEKYVAPPTLRLLASAFPGHDWKRWGEVKEPDLFDDEPAP